MDNFYLDKNENFDKTCGEIIITTKGRLALYCSLCGEYKNYEQFVFHLLERCSQTLDDDLRDAIIKFSLSTSTETSVFPAIENKKLSFNKSTPARKQSSKRRQILEEMNLKVPKFVEVEEFSENNLSVEKYDALPSEIEYFQNIEESILYEPEQQHSPNSSIVYSNVNTLSNLENNNLEIENCDDHFEENVNIERLEDQNSNTYEGENQQNELKNRHEEYKNNEYEEIELDIAKKSRQSEQNKPEQEQLMKKGHARKQKEPIPVDIPIVVRKVNKRKFHFGSKISDKERIFKCPVCDTAFSCHSNMKHHLKRHTDQRDHSCPKCEKKFFFSAELKIHLRSHGVVEKSFLCNDCGRVFETAYKLVCHQKRHKNQRDYKCEICSKAFYCSNKLKDHMACHTSNKPFSCELCGAKFKRSNGLSEHRKMHENQRKYKCKICGAAYNVHAGLHSHMKSRHKDTFNEQKSQVSQK